MADIAAVAQWFVRQLHGFQMLPQGYEFPSIKEKKNPQCEKCLHNPYYRIVLHLWAKMKKEQTCKEVFKELEINENTK